MTATQIKKLTFEDYFYYDDGTDNRYELEDRELLLMNPPTGRHALIIRFLCNTFDSEINRLNWPWVSLQNLGIRTSLTRSRIPDISVVTREQITEYLDRSAVLETPPILAIEIVSPESQTRYYRYKRSEYSVLGIPEYWIVDTEEQKVTVFLLEEGFYEMTEYRETERISSRIFSELSLTVEQILQG